jgi:hypothetical protein
MNFTFDIITYTLCALEFVASVNTAEINAADVDAANEVGTVTFDSADIAVVSSIA